MDLPPWFDSEPWHLIIEGGSGLPYSYFVKFRGSPAEQRYSLYLTDLCTIWGEVAAQDAIATKLKPYENFMELSISDLLGVLKGFFDDKAEPSFLLFPDGPDSLSMECKKQLGFVKFSWTFHCKAIDRLATAQHFRQQFIIPAIKAASGDSSSGKAINKETFRSFQEKLGAITPIDASNDELPPVLFDQPLVKEPVQTAKSVPIRTPDPVVEEMAPPKTAHELELERRKQLEAILKAPEDKKKKRKLI